MNRHITCASVVAAAALTAACYIPPGEEAAPAYEELTLPAISPSLGADFIRGMDISMVSAIEEAGGVFRDNDGNAKDIMDILKENGVNWVRLRLWHNPVSPSISPGMNNLERTAAMAKRAKDAGLKLLLDFHYSDTWADPGKQTKPAAWASLDITALKAAVFEYTKDTLTALAAAGAAPDMAQTGNEIGGGILFNDGKDETNLGELLSAAAAAIREAAPQALIMLHVQDGGKDWTAFFDKYAAHDGNEASKIAVDFDVIGLSWYPFFSSHKTCADLQNSISRLKKRYDKDVLVAETSFAWTLGYGDNTSNEFWTDAENTAGVQLAGADGVVIETRAGTETPCVPAGIANQALVVRAVMKAVKDNGGLGIFYWGGDWIPAPGIEDNWENQALFDFEGNALPSLAVFKLQ